MSIRPTASDIVWSICEVFEIETDVLMSACRRPKYSQARRMACHLMRDMTDMSYPEIATALGQSSHASVHRACKLDIDTRLGHYAAALARQRAAKRTASEETWAQPAVPARMLVYADRYLKSIEPQRATGARRMVRKKTGKGIC